MSVSSEDSLPNFFRVKQQFARPRVASIPDVVQAELSKTCRGDLTGRRVAITSGSRGVANIDRITKACVDFLQAKGADPFVVPAMGSHGGATAAGQAEVLATMGITEASMGCPVLSSMEVEQVCTAREGFPVYFDRHAMQADDVLVVNRIKPHTRFAGDIESGLMKMMLIGLGKQKGAEVYHQAIVKYSFDQIVRSVASEVIARCNILAGLAILENAYEETAAIHGVPPAAIEEREAELLRQVKQWMPSLPFDRADLLIIDQIGKNISGTGMDTNIIGRKKNEHAAIDGDKPDIHHIYVRALTEATHGNAAGIGLAELCHRRVIEAMDSHVTRMNCITASHVSGAMIPIDFTTDREALQTACKLSGYVPPRDVTAMWIQDTLHLDEVECSQAYLPLLDGRADLEVLEQPRALEFDEKSNLRTWFGAH